MVSHITDLQKMLETRLINRKIGQHITMEIINPWLILRRSRMSGNYMYISGYRIRTNSQRYQLFRDQPSCVTCGLTIGTATINPNSSKDFSLGVHVNFWGIHQDGHIDMMTKDHIIPKSKGGRDIISNYQTMCMSCNTKKGNSL